MRLTLVALNQKRQIATRFATCFRRLSRSQAGGTYLEGHQQRSIASHFRELSNDRPVTLMAQCLALREAETVGAP